MVVTRNVDNRWVKRYTLCFGIGIIIVLFQLYLALRFFNTETATVNNFNPHKIINFEDQELSANSARKGSDDEDGQQTNPRKQTVKGKVPVRLRVEELDFVPACGITTKEAVSAIHRAKTQNCKQLISNVTCLIQKGKLYPSSLPSACPNEGLEGGKSMGCFRDEKNFRLLSGYYGTNKVDNSPEYCMHLCLQSGFPYSGVQYSNECFCGNEPPPSTARLPDSSCNMKCPANPHEACGGYYTINIYQTGIKKFYPQIATTSSTNIKPVKIVFLLTLNGRALRQVKRLIKVLYQREHYFYIHVDVRQDYLFRELVKLEKHFQNIRLTRRRFATIWGGASLLTMLLSCMEELLQLDWKWDFVLNLSESDYPVKTVNRLVDFLSANRGKNFVKSHGREVQRFIQKQGLDKTFVECDTRMWRTGDRQLPSGIQIDGGSDWVALSRNFVDYVASGYPDHLVNGLLVFFKYTLLPAESFFHTVLRNSIYCDTYIDNNLHVTNWKRKLGCKCQYKHVVDWCGCSPNDFKPEDWLRIQNTEPRQLFFARKFEPIINQAVIVQLEQWLFGIDLSKVTNINSYWHSIYNRLDLGPQGDDSLITLTHSTIRTKLKSLSNCNLNEIKIIEIHSFHLNDLYKQTLILFEAYYNNSRIILETSFKPKDTLLLTKSTEFTYRLKSMYVSSDYDQKEQIFRNFPRVLGPYSEPTLMYHFTSSQDTIKNVNVTFIWIDPAGKLIETSDASIENAIVISHIKPNIKQPLLPGAWTVKLICNNEAVAETKFLITPLSVLSGNPISNKQVGFVHAGPNVLKEFAVSYEKFLPDDFERESLERLSVSNSKRFGLDLLEWIDVLYAKFYTVGSACGVTNDVHFCGAKLKLCKETDWSSMAADPKSFIGKVNETSGTFDLW